MNASPKTEWPKSLWHASATPFDDVSPLTTSISSEVCIIGAGFTGLSTALHLAEAGVGSVVIDMHQPGWGCSGRNGGQVNPCWKVLPETFDKKFSEAQKSSMIKVASAACDLLFDLVDFYKIDCRAIRPGYILGVVGSSGKRFIEEWTKQWRVPETAIKILNREQMRSTVGTDGYDLGMLDRRGGSVQPLSYARGLARVCLSKGVSLYGDTPATGISKEVDQWRVETPGGVIHCKKLVLANNGYTDDIWPGLKENIVPVGSLISATKPLPDKLAEEILPGRHAVSDTAGMPVYYRLDERNRMVFGGRGTWTGQLGNLDTGFLRQAAMNLYPQLKNIEWEFDWGGYVAMTTHHRPLLLSLDQNAWAGLGYNGRGVAMSTMMGKQLSMALQGKPTGLPVEQSRGIPFHRFNKAGIAARMISGRLKDKITRRL